MMKVEVPMANILIRNLPEQTKKILRTRAAEEGLSLEAYVRRILHKASSQESADELSILGLAEHYFGSTNGVELQLPTRKSKRREVHSP